MDEMVKLKRGETLHRWQTAIRDQAFLTILDLPVLQTRPEQFLRVLESGKVSTNVYLRRIHNFALDMTWLPWPVLVKRQWPKVQFKDKRAITWEEHQRIVEREQNAERKLFYQLAWHIGASQTDLASLHASNIDWENNVIGFARRKTGSIAHLRFGGEVAEILRQFPKKGPLFPYLRTVRAGDRATEFKQRCVNLGIEGVTLHSYRYAWAERARKAGYPERFAQEALGHNSKAVHRAYAKKAQVTLPPLEEYERNQSVAKIIHLPMPTEDTNASVTGSTPLQLETEAVARTHAEPGLGLAGHHRFPPVVAPVPVELLCPKLDELSA